MSRPTLSLADGGLQVRGQGYSISIMYTVCLPIVRHNSSWM